MRNCFKLIKHCSIAFIIKVTEKCVHRFIWIFKRCLDNKVNKGIKNIKKEIYSVEFKIFRPIFLIICLTDLFSGKAQWFQKLRICKKRLTTWSLWLYTEDTWNQIIRNSLEEKFPAIRHLIDLAVCQVLFWPSLLINQPE